MQPQPVETPTLSVIIPVYRSARILPQLHRRLSRVLQQIGQPYEIIFVDDGGPDDSWQVLQHICRVDPCVIAVQLMRNVGQSSATLCGLAHSRGRLLLTMDDDLQHPPEELPTLLAALDDEIDAVLAVPRVMRQAWYRRLGSRLTGRLIELLQQKPPNLRLSSFRLLRRPVADALLGMKTLTPALSMMICAITQRVINVTTEHAPRAEGRSGYSWQRLLRQVFSNLIGYSMLPLQLLALLGLIGIGCSLAAGGAAALAAWRDGGTVPDWLITVLALTLFSGLNFAAFALIGEYVLRILQRVNATPQFIVRSVAGGDTAAAATVQKEA